MLFYLLRDADGTVTLAQLTAAICDLSDAADDDPVYRTRCARVAESLAGLPALRQPELCAWLRDPHAAPATLFFRTVFDTVRRLTSCFVCTHTQQQQQQQHMETHTNTRQDLGEPQPFSSVLSKLSGSFAWDIVTAHVADGFFWYTPLGRPDVVTKLVALADVAVARAPQTESGLWPFDVQAGAWTKTFGAADEALREQWLQALCRHTREPFYHPHGAYAPRPRADSRAAWFVDGRAYFGAVAEAIRAAQREVFIADWVLSPAVYLERGAGAGAGARLDMLIKARADAGVHFYIVLWKETRVAMNLGSAHVEAWLAALGPNVHVLRHPLSFPLLWSHHQKIVVVDQTVAFVGGMDLTFGRYDDARHTLEDPCELRATWPGSDYYNPQYAECAPYVLDGRAAVERLRRPRMPWHDVGVALWDDACRLVAWNFIQRWAHHIGDMRVRSSFPFLVPRQPSTTSPAEGDTPTTTTPLDRLSFLGRAHMCRALAVRSLGAWSGSPVTESSCEAALVDMITRAEHYVYIENQYFTSLPSTPDAPHNRVADAIVARIGRALAERRPFRMVVLLPLFPEGALDQTTIRYIMQFHYETICRGPQSILARLAAAFPGTDLAPHLYFAALLNWGEVLLPRPHLVTNPIYVHSKLCIADDAVTLVGSCNINDRSLNGERDSEIAVVLHSRPFALSLRQHLWDEHVRVPATAPSPSSSSSQDSGDDDGYGEQFAAFRAACEHNTHVYREVFGPSFPQDGISCLTDMEPEPLALATPNARAVLTSQLRGHAVAYPLTFLDQEDLFPPPLSSEAMLDKRAFQ